MKDVHGNRKLSAIGTILAVLLIILMCVMAAGTFWWRSLEYKRELRDINMLNEAADIIKEAMDNDFTIENQIRDGNDAIDITLEDLMTGRDERCSALSGYLNTSLGFATHHAFRPVSRVAGNAEVYVRISRNGTVETLVTKTQGGHPIVCEYVTGDSTYTYTDESGRRKLFALR